MMLTIRLFVAAFVLVACNPKTTDGGATPGGAGPAGPAPPAAEADDSPALQLDPAVKTGMLDNGLTFYIRKHPKPEGRAQMWLAVNAGSVLEPGPLRGQTPSHGPASQPGSPPSPNPRPVSSLRTADRIATTGALASATDPRYTKLHRDERDPKPPRCGAAVARPGAGGVCGGPRG